MLTLTHKRKFKFQTFIGGVISIGILTVLILYAQYMFRIESNTFKSKNTVNKDLISDSEQLNLNSTSFAFAFYLQADFDPLIDSSYLVVSLNQYTDIRNSEGIKSTKVTPVPLKTCGDTFNYYNQTVLGIQSYICPDINSLYVQGNTYSDVYSYFELTIEKCSGDGCKSSDEIRDAIINSWLDLPITNTYFDFDNYDQPVGTFIDDNYWYDLMPGFEKTDKLYIRQNEVELFDSLYHYSPFGDVQSFVGNKILLNSFMLIIGIERSTSGVSLEQLYGRLLTITFTKDSMQNSYTRSVYSVLNFSGDLGGINELLTLVGSIIVGFFSSHIFIYSILSSLYQVEADLVENSKLPNENKVHPSIDLSNSVSNKINTSDTNLFGTAISRRNEIINNAKECMKRRFRYNYSIFDFAYNFLYPFKCVKCRTKEPESIKYKYSFYHRYKLFEKGRDKYAKEFDILNIARSIRKLKILAKTIEGNRKEEYANKVPEILSKFVGKSHNIKNISLLTSMYSNKIEKEKSAHKRIESIDTNTGDINESRVYRSRQLSIESIDPTFKGAVDSNINRDVTIFEEIKEEENSSRYPEFSLNKSDRYANSRNRYIA